MTAPKIDPFEGLGEALRLLREGAGLSQADLAKLAGTQQQSISAYESGGELKVSTLGRVLRACGATLGDLEGALRESREGKSATTRPSVARYKAARARTLEELAARIERLEDELLGGERTTKKG
jgi:transcriptional regulator with XRE-family HTH domain